jgi:HSP20 family protein
MSRMVDRMSPIPSWQRAGETGPPVDLYETEDAVIIRLAIPGGDTGALTLTIGEESIRVRGETPAPGAWGERTVVHWQEIPYGRFDRSVPLPCPVESKASRARFIHGILEVTLAKLRTPETRTIPITITRA